MIPADVVARLATLPAADPPGFALLAGLGALVDRFEDAEGEVLERLTEQESAIEQAIEQLNGYTRAAEKIIERCTQLPPQPSTSVPAGF